MSHTKGNWNWDHNNPDQIKSDRGEVVFEVCGGLNKSLNEIIANGKLGAAAPDMLEALTKMVEQFWGDAPEYQREEIRKLNPSIVASEAAIKKATA